MNNSPATETVTCPCIARVGAFFPFWAYESICRPCCTNHATPRNCRIQRQLQHAVQNGRACLDLASSPWAGLAVLGCSMARNINCRPLALVDAVPRPGVGPLARWAAGWRGSHERLVCVFHRPRTTQVFSTLNNITSRQPRTAIRIVAGSGSRGGNRCSSTAQSHQFFFVEVWARGRCGGAVLHALY